MKAREQILVLGGDSAIGAALGSSFEIDGRFKVRPTTRRIASGNDLFFDALDDASWDRLPEAAAAVILCFGETSLEKCESDPGGTRSLNVDATLHLARRYGSTGAHVVCFSSNLVFDGRHPHARLQDERRPQGEYGRQKAAVEDALLEIPAVVTVFRITKFVESLKPLILRWTEDLRAHRPITPFHDRHVCPVDRILLGEALRRAIERKASGIFQLSGEADVTYHQLASWTADALGASHGLLAPVSQQGRLREPQRDFSYPRWTSLDMTDAAAALDVAPTPLSHVRKFVEETAQARVRENAPPGGNA